MIRRETFPRGLTYAAAVGTFDGLHLGHQALLTKVTEYARQHGCASVAVTFREHPLSVLDPRSAPRLITSREERARLMEELGIDELIELPFEEIRKLPAESFIEELVRENRLVFAAAGFNFRFGAGGTGDAMLLKKMGRRFGYEAHIEPPFCVDGAPVSSSRIRTCLREGNAGEASRLLGRPYSVTGVTTRGKQLGRVIGFPTVNIPEDPACALLPSGVYAARVRWSGRLWDAMLNLGTNPTVETLAARRYEAHVLENGFAPGYGEFLSIEIVSGIRGEKKFTDVEALTEQLQQDREEAQKILSNCLI